MSFVARLRPARLPRELVTLATRGPVLRQASILASRPPSALPHQPLRHARQFHQSLVWREEATQDRDQAQKATEFAQLEGTISGTLLDTISKDMRLTTMTPVQSNTIHEALKGVDVLAQAKTGTGKTLGFLLPVVQSILNADNSLLKPSFHRGRRQYDRNRRMGFADTDTHALVISPTRELAEQIAEVARQLTRRTGIKVQTAVGGTAKAMHMRLIKSEGCHLLVGTPGRINDILSDQYGGIGVPKLKTLVLDEADRLLDQGFRPEIDAIKELLPLNDRQNLMYSATIDREVQSLARAVMKRDMHFVETVSKDEVPTTERVQQNLVVTAGAENQLITLLELIKEAEANPTDGRPFKAIVYFNSSLEVQWAIDIAMRLKRSRRSDLLPSHLRFGYITSRRSQASRTAAADDFRNATSAVLFSSDVTARGMDFPNVTHVIQVGVPSDRDTYIHRLGRTARAGNEGQGWLLVPRNAGADIVSGLLKGIPMERRDTLKSAQLDLKSYDPATLKEPDEEEPYGVQVNAAALALAQQFGTGEMLGQLKATAGAMAQNVSPDQVRESLCQMAEVQFGMKWSQDIFPFLRQRRAKPMSRFGRGGGGGGGGGSFGYGRTGSRAGNYESRGGGSGRLGSRGGSYEPRGRGRGGDGEPSYPDIPVRRQSARDRGSDREMSFGGDSERRFYR